ncbi:MAG: hypothetical protein GX452_13340 [Ignavibacteriales bacterium]|jgi:hypothetical protein|nr:hypothetical protein [Ignavibacteriaceae bacterium]NLH62378.1 hypothetical protein [Ignavibacteriales bacterium]
MKYFDEDEILFEKIRRKPKELRYSDKTADPAVLEQVFGSGHLVDDSKVSFGQIERDDFKESKRPGIVITPPSEETAFETEWIPGTGAVKNRNEELTLFLDSGQGKVKKKTAFLIQYRQYYKYFTLSSRVFMLPADKLRELELKLNNL